MLSATAAIWMVCVASLPHPVVLSVIVAAGILLLVGAIYGSKAEARRRLLLRGFAKRRGLAWEPRKSTSIERRFAQFDCFQQGTSRYGYNTMRGTWGGRDMWCFDYHYETQSADTEGISQTHEHHSSNVIFEADRSLRELAIRREGFFDRVAGAFGYDDIDFESAEFSRDFHVKTSDKKWAYDVISQKTMQLLMRAPSFHIELGGRHILVRRANRLTPDGYDVAMKLGKQILDGIPADAV